jgi:hypothetical protein
VLFYFIFFLFPKPEYIDSRNLIEGDNNGREDKPEDIKIREKKDTEE